MKNITRYIMQLSVVALVLSVEAANCPNGQPQITYSLTNNNNPIDATAVGLKWEWTVTVPVTKTLNCKASPCITTIEGTIRIMGQHQDPANPMVVYWSGGETSGVEPGTVNLCDAGDFVTYFIIYNPSEPTFAKLIGVTTWFQE